MHAIVDAFLGAIGTGILTILVLLIRKLIKSMTDDDLTMKALAHDAYFRHARYLLAKESITEEELENHNYLYRAYHAQGLNSTGDRLHEMVMQKPVNVMPETALSEDFVKKLP